MSELHDMDARDHERTAPLPEAVRELQRIRAEMRGRLGPSWPPNDQAGTWVHEWMERIRKVEALWEAAAQQERASLVSVDDVLAIFQRWHDSYPQSVFPPDGESKDCHSAAMGRHMAMALRSEVLELVSSHPPTPEDR